MLEGAGDSAGPEELDEPADPPPASTDMVGVRTMDLLRDGVEHGMAPAAVAAGFAVVAGTLVVTQMAGGPSSPDAAADMSVAQSPSAFQAVALSDKAASATGEAPSVVLSGQLVRDARLDEYLAAHKRFGGSSLPGGPSGLLRNASVEMPAR